MNYPFTDDFMKFQILSKRYVLTEKAVLDKLGIDLSLTLNIEGSDNPSMLPERILDFEISQTIYNYIYAHTFQRDLVEQLLMYVPRLRSMLFEAMLSQVLYFMNNGGIARYAGLNLKSGNAMDLSALRGQRRIDPQAELLLEQPLHELGGRPITFRGFWPHSHYCGFKRGCKP